LTDPVLRRPDDDLSRVMLAAAAGDRVARDGVVTAVTDDVRRLCRYLGDEDSVDDLVQESFERIMRALPSYRGDGPAIHWVRQIVRRTCADATRRRTRQRRRDRLSTDGQIDESVLDGATTEFDDLLERLDRDRRDAFLVTQVLGLSYAEAAVVLDCPIGTVRSRVARARVDLIAMLGVGVHTDAGSPDGRDDPGADRMSA
jgi:RNA polymerase sigma-70 factor (ECF subfamily)